MSTASIKLYNILIDKGVDRDVAREAIDEFVTKEDAQTFATKADIKDIENSIKGTENRLIMWMIGIQIAVVGLLIATKLTS